MRAIGHIKQRLRIAGHKDGHHQGDIRQVRAAGIGVIQHGDVAGTEHEGIDRAATDMGMDPRCTGM